jgi:hypothetical protein
VRERPTRTRVHPVAQGGIDAKMGAKNMEMRKQTPQVMAVRPVLPPSAIPAPDSMTAKRNNVSGYIMDQVARTYTL